MILRRIQSVFYMDDVENACKKLLTEFVQNDVGMRKGLLEDLLNAWIPSTIQSVFSQRFSMKSCSKSFQELCGFSGDMQQH